MQFESPYMTFYTIAIAMFAVTLLTRYRNQNMHDLDLTFGTRSSIKMSYESPDMIFCLIARAVFHTSGQMFGNQIRFLEDLKMKVKVDQEKTGHVNSTGIAVAILLVICS